MEGVIATSRLILREFKLSDAKKICELNNDPEVLKYTGDVPFESVENTQQFLKKYGDYKKNGYGRWAVILKNNHEFIGWCGLKLNIDNKVDIGFRFFKEYWNQGYATESATACLQYGFRHLKISEIIGRASVKNKPSIKVLEKIQMTYWKTEIYGGIGSSVFYKLSDKEYFSLSKKYETSD